MQDREAVPRGRRRQGLASELASRLALATGPEPRRRQKEESDAGPDVAPSGADRSSLVLRSAAQYRLGLCITGSVAGSVAMTTLARHRRPEGRALSRRCSPCPLFAFSSPPTIRGVTHPANTVGSANSHYTAPILGLCLAGAQPVSSLSLAAFTVSPVLAPVLAADRPHCCPLLRLHSQISRSNSYHANFKRRGSIKDCTLFFTPYSTHAHRTPTHVHS